MDELSNLLKDASAELGISLSNRQIEQFIQYKDILLDYNQRINLTAITDEHDVILKHFADCIALIKPSAFNGDEAIIDIGSGAGFPAIPLKIALPNIKLTIVDSLNKRITFLQLLVEKLELSNVECIHSRAELLGKNNKYRENFDICTSRAVAYLPTLSEYCIPFVRKGGFFLAMKGANNIKEELDESLGTITTLGGKYIKLEEYTIPFTDITHTVVFIKKQSETPLKYPRDPSKIKKTAK